MALQKAVPLGATAPRAEVLTAPGVARPSSPSELPPHVQMLPAFDKMRLATTSTHKSHRCITTGDRGDQPWYARCTTRCNTTTSMWHRSKLGWMGGGGGGGGGGSRGKEQRLHVARLPPSVGAPVWLPSSSGAYVPHALYNPRLLDTQLQIGVETPRHERTWRAREQRSGK